MQKFPLLKPYKYASVGDFKGDKSGMVKTPTLRNILRTGPIFPIMVQFWGYLERAW